MQLSLQPFTTAGIALVGASAIALSPLAPPPVTATPPDVQAHEVNLHASSLSLQLPDINPLLSPLATWGDLLTKSAINAGEIGEAIATDPAPILRQAVINQIGNAQLVAQALQKVARALPATFDPNSPNGLATGIRQAIEFVMAGDMEAASNALLQGIIATGFGVGFPLLALTKIPVSITKNLYNGVSTAMQWPLDLGYRAISLTSFTFLAAGSASQDVVDAIMNGDPIDAAGALLNAPAIVANAMLNGDPTYGSGLLSDNGLLRGFLDAADAIASSIAPAAPAAALTAVTSSSPTVAASANEIAATPESINPATDSSATALVSTDSTADMGSTAPTPVPESAEPDGTPAVVVSSTGATDLSAGNKVEPGTAAARSAQSVKASLENAADQVNKGIKKLSTGIEKSVKKVTDNIAKAGKKKQTAGSTSSASASDKAGTDSDD